MSQQEFTFTDKIINSSANNIKKNQIEINAHNEKQFQEISFDDDNESIFEAINYPKS